MRELKEDKMRGRAEEEPRKRVSVEDGNRWTSRSKEGVGTAYNTSSRVWFTISHGILNEVYYPRIDRPQIRDVQFLITDGETFFHEEKRDLIHRIEYIGSAVRRRAWLRTSAARSSSSAMIACTNNP